jgi:RNA polymerase sigma-70 factor (sigma-E family)
MSLVSGTQAGHSILRTPTVRLWCNHGLCPCLLLTPEWDGLDKLVGSRGNHFGVTGGLMVMRDTPPAGFVDFVVARGPALHRTAVLLTRHQQAAEDLVQIALAKAWASWDRVDGNHEAYVRAIIVNEFASSWRRRWRGELPTADLPTRFEPVGEDLGDSASTRQGLLAALATLPARQRAVVVLRFFHDYTEAATAQAMGTSVGTVKSQTFKALAALRVSDELAENPAPELHGAAREELTR